MSHNWKKILVSPTATIKEVLKVIDSEALQLALVVDDDNRLLGTVTDGDVRRALINGSPLSHTIYEIMFTTPTVADLSMSKTKILELMNAKELGSIPILNDGIVVEQEYWRFCEGEYWTEGRDVFPPQRSKKDDAHQITCILLQKK